MKLIKAKSRKNTGGAPYITLPKGAKVGGGDTPSPEPKELTPDEVASYVATIYEEEPTDIVVSELPKVDDHNPPMEGYNNSFYLLTWRGWTTSAISKTPPGTVATMTMRSSDNAWGWHFTFCPLCLLPLQDGLDFQILIKVFQVTYTD